MGVFNFFIVIPQIVAAGILGFILSTFFRKYLNLRADCRRCFHGSSGYAQPESRRQ